MRSFYKEGHKFTVCVKIGTGMFTHMLWMGQNGWGSLKWPWYQASVFFATHRLFVLGTNHNVLGSDPPPLGLKYV